LLALRTSDDLDPPDAYHFCLCRIGKYRVSSRRQAVDATINGRKVAK
jgi:hypothetical protein